MTTHIKIKCNCGERWVSVKRSKKKFIEGNYYVNCTQCEWRCEMLEIKNEREMKLDAVLNKINT